MTPITGPFTGTQNWTRPSPGTGQTEIYQQRRFLSFRQAKPYDRPLEYHSIVAWVSYTSCSLIWNVHFSDTLAYQHVNAANWSDPYISAAYNKAYASLVSKLKSSTAELGAGIAEFRKTADMVSDRSVQLYRFVRAVSRGRFGDANSILRIPPGFRPRARSLGGAVLEYSFGWAPTVMDIYNGMKVLTGGVPPSYASARAGSSIPTTTFASGMGLPLGQRYNRIYSGSVKVQCGAAIHITNPNLWLANQLGLINPISVAWELVPFSFVVDYFVNVGDVINSWSEWFGAEILYPYRTRVLELDSREYQEYGTGGGVGSPCYAYGATWRLTLGHAARMGRELSLPGPTLQLSAPNVSLRRAATSISLLLQLLKGR